MFSLFSRSEYSVPSYFTRRGVLYPSKTNFSPSLSDSLNGFGVSFNPSRLESEVEDRGVDLDKEILTNLQFTPPPVPSTTPQQPTSRRDGGLLLVT